MCVGIVAPGSPVGQAELDRGVETLREAGFDVRPHTQCRQLDFVFAGTDEQRAQALWQSAVDPQIDVVWAARGGYGAARLLPLLDKLTDTHGPPPRGKLLVGYSDVTALHEFVRRRWRWATLHAPMVSSNLRALPADQWQAIVDLIHGRRGKISWQEIQLSFITPAPGAPIRAQLIGGNLSLWASLAGTPYQPKARGKIVFLEELSERPYRIDRMVNQLVQSGMLDGAAAIVLGDFTDCGDETKTSSLPPHAPLRPVYSLDESLHHIFAPLGHRLGIPIAKGLPVGHGPNHFPLPLGARYELDADGSLRLGAWNWRGRRKNSLLS